MKKVNQNENYMRALVNALGLFAVAEVERGETFAQRLGVSSSAINNYENEKRFAYVMLVEKLYVLSLVCYKKPEQRHVTAITPAFLGCSIHKPKWQEFEEG